jgi:hypothetical protein
MRAAARTRRTVAWLAGAAATAALLAIGVHAAARREPRAAMRAYVDPATGQLAPAPAGAGAAAAAPALPAPTTAFVEVPLAGGGGGVSVRLGDQFRTTMRATIGPDGRPTAYCTDESARRGG